MDNHNRLLQSDSSEDEGNHFTRYMDDNGIIGMEEGTGLELADQEVLESEEDEEQKMLDFGVERMVELYEDGLPYPESPSEGDGSGAQSWKEEFSFSQMAEEQSHSVIDTETLRNSDIIINHDTDDLSFAEHPSMSVTLPSALNRRPPSRDLQLDMTEDEVDRGSSLGAWDGDEDENWNREHSESLYGESPGLGRYEETSVREEQWDNNPGSPEQEYSENQGNQEDEAVSESLSPSPPPIPSTWGTRIMSHFGRLSLTPRIEDETLPESSCADSGESPTAVPARAPTIASNLTKVSKQDNTLRTKPTRSPSSSLRTQHADNLNVKKAKRSNIPLYGKGQLNYPLPDFSKVGPRVRFPRDEQGYQPPQPRRVDKQNQGAPVIFKSPAEIVREVLLSSTEKPIQEPVIPPTVPREFKSPQQATELVHQLQEDYHKLLTKYAEAENTIDRLRLGAKVHLYSDPAQPSHSVQMGTVVHGSKVMEFTIPHMQTATITSANEHHVLTEEETDSFSPSKLSLTPSEPTYPNTSGISSLHPPEDTPEDVTSTLMEHLETLHQEVELFEELLHGGNLTPGEQRQAVRELRGSLDVLERRYLKAQEQYRQEQRRTGTGHPPKELDPKRELEEVIFQLGVQLDELQERIHNSALSSPNTQLKNNSVDIITTHHLGNAPAPSAVVPMPALQTPYPQVPSPEPHGLSGADVGTLNKEDPAEYVPQPIRHKHMQVERDYGTLMSTYSSFKSLPDALGLEQDEWPQELPQNARPHGQPQDVSTQGHVQSIRSQDHTQATRPLLDPMTSGRPQVHQDHLQAVSAQDHPAAPKTRRHSQTANQQRRPRTVTPQSGQPSGSSMDNLHGGRPTSGTSVRHTPTPTHQGRKTSISSVQRTPDEGKYSATRRMSHGSETFPQPVSLRSPSLRLREQSSSAPKAVLSFSEESTQGPQSRKNSSSSKSVSPSAQREPSRSKGDIAQRRILSPETDSGFLGSESGRSLLLQKQRDQLSLNRDNPAELPGSSAHSPMKRGRRLSKPENDQSSRTRKALWERTKQNGHWAGLSEVSSPSPGPKSLTESESRDRSETDESDSEQGAFNDVMRDPSSGVTPLLSPIEELSQPHGNVLESRTARDRAIHNLQKEVIQLRQHLENSLNRSPTRGILGQSAANQNHHEEKIAHFAPGLGSPISTRGAPLKESRAEHLLSSAVSRDRDPAHRAAQAGRGVRGPYTGSRYHLLGSPSLDRTEQVTVPHCQRCQENEKKGPVSVKTPREAESALPIHPACPLCHGNNESDNTPRTGTSHGQSNRRPRSRPRRHPHCSHVIMGHTPPVSYIQAPLVPYSPPVIYGTSPGVYVPVGYNVADLRPPCAVAPPPKPDVVRLDDLSWPLSQALEAAKELKTTSKRMCQSLTMDLSMQRHLRSSCLF
ncbi:microtubule organization protein AKNA isoform X2 [Mixophyes fleayi]|uniref:microtubule organization protein AKNA isoform X2 n=1 Tax=Mixophyes fleayi TaxID=3061075 RepID=UPI003F4DFC57